MAEEEAELLLNVRSSGAPASKAGRSSKERWTRRHAKARRQAQGSKRAIDASGGSAAPSRASPRDGTDPDSARIPELRAEAELRSQANPNSSRNRRPGGDAVSLGKPNVAARFGQSIPAGNNNGAALQKMIKDLSSGTIDGDKEFERIEHADRNDADANGKRGETGTVRNKRVWGQKQGHSSVPSHVDGGVNGHVRKEEIRTKRQQVLPGGDKRQAAEKLQHMEGFTEEELPSLLSKEVFADARFADLGLCESLARHITESLGFAAPTHVQRASIPAVLSCKDVMVRADTGSGKTIAYLAPIVHCLQARHQRVARSQGTHGVSILIATPGRLLDHLRNTSSFQTSNLRWLVFDEADRLLDLGFEDDISEIVERLQNRDPSQHSQSLAVGSKKLQTLLLSATLNMRVQKLASRSLQRPVRVTVKGEEVEVSEGDIEWNTNDNNKGEGNGKRHDREGVENAAEKVAQEKGDEVKKQTDGNIELGSMKKSKNVKEKVGKDLEISKECPRLVKQLVTSNEEKGLGVSEKKAQLVVDSSISNKKKTSVTVVNNKRDVSERADAGQVREGRVAAASVLPAVVQEESEGDDGKLPLFLSSWKALTAIGATTKTEEEERDEAEREEDEREIDQNESEEEEEEEEIFDEEEEENAVEMEEEESMKFNVHEQFTIPKQLQQHYVKVPDRHRLVTLLALLHHKLTVKGAWSRAVIFFASCDSVDFHHSLFSSLSSPPSEATPSDTPPLLSSPLFKLHGNMRQSDRGTSFSSFRRAASALLLCTDVAARGLDFPAVSAIVQFDSPGDVQDYVHRVGRTARIGQKGEAFLFLRPHEGEYTNLLQKHGVNLQMHAVMPLLQALPWPPSSTGDQARKKLKKHRKGYNEGEYSGIAAEPKSAAWIHEIEETLERDRQLLESAAEAFRATVRAYAVQKGALQQIFHAKSLHFGHVAASLGLRQAPSLVGRSAAKKAANERKHGQLRNHKRRKLQNEVGEQ